MIFATTTRFNRHLFASLPLLALLALSAACGSDSGGGTGGAGGSSATGGAGGSGATGGAGGSGGTGGAGGSNDAGGGTGIYGAFVATLFSEPPPPYTKLIGQIYDGPQPPQQVLKLDSEEQGCQLLVPKVSFCDPKCTNAVCVDTNTCMPYPNLIGVGTAQITGFTGGPLMLTEPMNKIYQPTPTLPADACSEGGAIEVHTDKFTLQGKCVASLELMAKSTDKIPVKSGMPVKVVWTAPKQAGISRVEIHLDIAHHGGKKGEINCDVPDNGSFDIPATLVTKLVNLGLAGFPTIDVRRVSTATAPTEPNIKLQVDSIISRDVDTGVVSCNDMMPCPPGQTCDRDLSCK